MARTKGSITRCGHCYENGHNRAGCAQLKQEIAADPDGYYARRAKRKKMMKKKRKCGYCENTGHNAATCSTRKTDITAYTHMNWKYQNAMSAVFRKSGFGVGSIISTQRQEHTRHYLVTEVNLSQINLANSYQRGLGDDSGQDTRHAIKCQRLDLKNMSDTDLQRDWCRNVAMLVPSFAHKAIFGENDYDSSSQNYTVVGPVKVSSKKMDFDRESGMAFIKSKEMGGGLASRYIRRMQKKIENSEIR